jgi:serine protease Do
MRYVGWGLVAGAMALAAASGCGPTWDPVGAYMSLEVATKLARDKVYPATVRVDVRHSEFESGEKRRVGGNGSGVIFDADGHVLTNWHVAGRAEEITCLLFNKERVKATLVGGDPWTDLAVIKLDPAELKEKGVRLRYAVFGNSDDVEEGDGVLAIGSPFGLSRSISSGIVSCRDRILGEAMALPGGLETGLFSTWIQTDAAINPGNSGGPLVNFRGEVIGINTRGGGNDLGFAVPINVAKGVMRQILDKGKVTRSTIGLALQPLQDLETYFEVGKTEGAVVGGVEPDGPAARAGVQPQDVLLEWNGVKVHGRYPEELFDLRRTVSQTPVGAKVPVKVKRGASVLDLEITTEELTTLRGEEMNFPKWGLVVQDITDRLAKRENLPTTRGVYVTGVRPGEPAEKARLARADVIIRIDDRDVADTKDLKTYYDLSIKEAKPLILLRVRRGMAFVPVLLKVEYAKDEKPEPAEAPKADEKPKTEEKPKADEKPKTEEKPKEP